MDNVFMFGSAIEPEKVSGPAKKMGLAIAELNARIRDDKRVDVTMLNIADGLTLAFKK